MFLWLVYLHALLFFFFAHFKFTAFLLFFPYILIFHYMVWEISAILSSNPYFEF